MTYGNLVADVQAHPGLAGYVVAIGTTVRWLTQAELLRILGGCEPGEYIPFEVGVEQGIYYIRQPDAPLPVRQERWLAGIPARIAELVRMREREMRENKMQVGRA